MTKKSNFHNKDSLITFIVVLVAILALALLAWFWEPKTAAEASSQARLRLIENTIGGLMAILGMAAQAVLRLSATEKELIGATSETNKALAEKVPPPTGEAKEAIEEGMAALPMTGDGPDGALK